VSAPADRLSPVVRVAPAKVNLTLAVVGRRPDGFHALHSVMAATMLADRLSMAPRAIEPGAPAVDSLHVTGFDPGPPAHNLVLRAVALARQAVRLSWPAAPAEPPPLAIRLDKRIPIAAGLAGGSSDAAAALDGALEAWGVELSVGDRIAFGARLGSDVPFFLAGGPVALVEGRGERVAPLVGVRGRPAALLLVTPAVAVSTVAVYAAYDGGAGPPDRGSTLQASRHLADELAAGALSAAQLADRGGVLASANDLLAATGRIAPEVVRFRRSLARLLGRRIGQSGSGPTTWTLYPSHDEAEAAANVVERALDEGGLAPGGPRPFVMATTMATTSLTATRPGAEEPIAVRGVEDR
jgi:4-diphosphocytidyl-2-C-methyl-D-erythritol kinase